MVIFAASPDNPIIPIGLFPTAFPRGPAIGLQGVPPWSQLVAHLHKRREGEKDGPGYVPCLFERETDGKHVHRKNRNVITRSAIAMDVEANKQTGELPPSLAEIAERLRRLELRSVVYSSHNHDPKATRCRIFMPLSVAIAPELPVVELMAERLGLTGVYDRSKRGPNILYYFPSANPGELGKHQTIVIEGQSLDGPGLAAEASKILAAQQAEQDRKAAEARAAVEAKRQARIRDRVANGESREEAERAEGEGLIAKIRARLPGMGEVLLAHGYDENGGRYRHPNSTSGSYGLNIRVFGGVERLYSFNGGDPLCPDNLPAWCGGVTAIDVVDVVTILEFNSDRPLALRTLARRFGIPLVHAGGAGAGEANKLERGKGRVLARTIFRSLRSQLPQAVIEAAALREGTRLGLSPSKIVAIASWVVQTARARRAA
jgi:hypothetical protein